ncbi:MAG: FUSC family protein [Verrucomicrobiaceae bacterium]|nr:MAG: FUSC family protein [Verrucomicrobiaceae bacterium]
MLQGGTFRAVWHRNVHRIAGTALGMGISWFLFPRVPDPVMMAVTVTILVFIVEYLVSRNYGLAVIFITPLTVCFAEFASGGVPIHGLFATRLLDIVIGSLIGAAGGSILHHPDWCRRMEASLVRFLPVLRARG